MIVHTANLVDFENDNRSRETEGATCQGLSDQPDCTGCAKPKMATRERPLPSALYTQRGQGRLWKFEASVG